MSCLSISKLGINNKLLLCAKVTAPGTQNCEDRKLRAFVLWTMTLDSLKWPEMTHTAGAERAGAGGSIDCWPVAGLKDSLS